MARPAQEPDLRHGPHQPAPVKQVHVDAGIDVFFCDPHAPWQRGSNENTNGLLRQYFPKGFDFSTVTEAELDAVADELNERPRKRLEFANPTERLSELLLQ
jgi:transposase, IS30 family